jgi:hypothetical protein
LRIAGVLVVAVASSGCGAESVDPPVHRSVEEPDGCAEHVELFSAARWASELAQPETWVVDNYRIKLWSQSGATGSKGRAVGELLPGSRALILAREPGGFKVKSPLDGSVGWLGEIQVARTRWQDTQTRASCIPTGQGWRIRDDGLVECADGRVVMTDKPHLACR